MWVSIRKKYEEEKIVRGLDPDPNKNVTDPQHCL
jgi:hypothetical protein